MDVHDEIRFWLVAVWGARKDDTLFRWTSNEDLRKVEIMIEFNSMPNPDDELKQPLDELNEHS